MTNNFRKPVLINNFQAKGGRLNAIFDKYYGILKHENLFEKIDVFESKSREETIDFIAKIHSGKKYDLIISMGGDGSISTIVNGLMELPINKRLPLFPLPTGSGNSLLRDYNITTIDDSLEHYKTQKPKFYDVLLLESLKRKYKQYCINVIGLGFISDIADYVVGKGKIWGSLSYVFGTVLALKKFRPYDTTITFDNGKKKFHSERAFFITLSNTKYTGGPIMIAPDAKHDDGLIDITVLHDINRMQFLNGFRKTFNGKHIHDKGCLYLKAKSVVIYSKPDYIVMPDGDLEGKSPIKVTVKPKQIRLVV